MSGRFSRASEIRASSGERYETTTVLNFPGLPLSLRVHRLLRTSVNAGPWYGILRWMAEVQKITVEVPAALLEKARRASGAGITETVRAGLQLVAASQAYSRLRSLRGKVRFSRTASQLKADR